MVVRWLLEHYCSAKSSVHPYNNANPRARPTVYLLDMMEFIKGLPSTIKDTYRLRAYFAETVRRIFKRPGSTIRTVVVMVDKKCIKLKESDVTNSAEADGDDEEDRKNSNDFFVGAPVGKMVHERVTRDKKYLERAGSLADSSESSTLSLSRANTDTDDDLVLDEHDDDKDYHVIPDNNNRRLPPDWGKYTRMRDRVRREVYPLLLNTLSDDRFLVLQPGQCIVTSGLPFCLDDRPVWIDGKTVDTIFMPNCAITEEMEQLDPDIYNRTALIRRHKEPGKAEMTIRLHWSQWDNAIWEADHQVPFFMGKFGNQNILVRANDRDFVPICLLQSIDRLDNGKFRNHVYLELPSKSKKGGKTVRTETYVSVNELYAQIDRDEDMAPKVYNRVATMVFLIIMVGCDHTRKGFLKGMHPIKHVMETFYAHSASYSHMVQLSRLLVPDPNAIRIPLVDERAFFDFVNRCYVSKHAEAVARKQTKEYEKEVRAVERERAKRKRQREQEQKQVEKLKRKQVSTGNIIRTFQFVVGGDERDEEESDEEFFAKMMPQKPVATPSRRDLKKHVKRKDPDQEVPERTTTRKDCRYCTHTLLYYYNAGKPDGQDMFKPGGLFDPLKKSKVDGESYWGYEVDNKTRRVVAAEYVSSRQDLTNIPGSYIRHMWEKKSKFLRQPSVIVAQDEDKKREAEQLLQERKQRTLAEMGLTGIAAEGLKIAL